MARVTSFSSEVGAKLKTYVYRLIDPRNGDTFYVGKGKGNRVFAHARGEANLEGDDLDNQIKRIREIHPLEVIHVIHRHGMDDPTALEVEAALIDAYPEALNAVGGHGANDYGPMHVEEIVRRYEAPVAEVQHKALLICVNRMAAELPLYEATRYAWRIKKDNAQQAELVLPHRSGLIIGAFVPESWLDATHDNFPGREDAPGRIGFKGHDAPPEIKDMYVGKRVPDEYRQRGAVAPVRYTWN